MQGFANFALHQDVVGAVLALKACGYRLITLSNGSTQPDISVLNLKRLDSKLRQEIYPNS